MIIFQVIENIKNGGKEENECVIKSYKSATTKILFYRHKKTVFISYI